MGSAASATRRHPQRASARGHADPRLIAAAYAESAEFGFYVEVAAVTGARLSQIARLNVADLQNGGEPRLMMPCSRKGRGERKITHKPVSGSNGANEQYLLRAAA